MTMWKSVAGGRGVKTRKEVCRLNARNAPRSSGGARALFFTTLTKKKGGGFTVGDTAQLDAEDFANQHDRSRWPELKAKVAAVVATRTRDEWDAVLEGSDACYAPKYSLTDKAVLCKFSVNARAPPRFGTTPTGSQNAFWLTNAGVIAINGARNGIAPAIIRPECSPIKRWRR